MTGPGGSARAAARQARHVAAELDLFGQQRLALRAEERENPVRRIRRDRGAGERRLDGLPRGGGHQLFLAGFELFAHGHQVELAGGAGLGEHLVASLP
jgi:hypothetical protein